MVQIPKELKFLLFVRGVKWHAQASMVLAMIALVCLILGIVSDAVNKTLGLESTNWLMIAVALFVWGWWGWMTAYTAAKEG